jgi:hypothetical protein
VFQCDLCVSHCHQEKWPANEVQGPLLKVSLHAGVERQGKIGQAHWLSATGYGICMVYMLMTILSLFDSFEED